MIDSDIVVISGLVYSHWARSAERLMAIKKETNDGSKDWAEFHQERLTRATEEEFLNKGLLDRYVAEYRETIEKSFGL